MSYTVSDDAPPVRKASTSKSMRGRTSTAYAIDTPLVSIQEATPVLDQNEFTDEQTNVVSSASRVGSPHTPSRVKSPSPVITPTDSKDEATPRQHIERRTSIPMRGIHDRSPSTPVVTKIHCEECQSVHSILISSSRRATIQSCSTTTTPAPPAPSILSMYSLPGYMATNESGQLLVKTESELLSYVRKIFSPVKGYNGFFPHDRTYNIQRDEVLADSTSASSTPDSARASYFKGHSHYRGTFLAATEETSTKSSKNPSVTSETPDPRSISPDPFAAASYTSDAGPPPPENYGTKPSTPEYSRSRSVSPMVSLRTVSPLGRPSMQSTNPSHASAARQSSPRNLHAIGVFSDSEVDLRISTQSESDTEKEVARDYMPRSSLSVQQKYQTRTAMPAELYSESDEISKELEAQSRPTSRAKGEFAPFPPSPQTRGRDVRRR